MKKYIVYTKENGKIETSNYSSISPLTIHKLDGPAIHAFYSNGKLNYTAYYINDVWYTKSDYEAEIFKMNLSLL